MVTALRSEVTPVRPASRRPGIGFRLAVGLGLATQAVSARTALLGFSAALAAVLAVVARRLLRPGPVAVRP